MSWTHYGSHRTEGHLLGYSHDIMKWAAQNCTASNCPVHIQWNGTNIENSSVSLFFVWNFYFCDVKQITWLRRRQHPDYKNDVNRCVAKVQQLIRLAVWWGNTPWEYKTIPWKINRESPTLTTVCSLIPSQEWHFNLNI